MSNHDPLMGAAAALHRLLNGPSVEEVTEQLHTTMERAAEVDHPTRPIIMGQVNVLTVVTGWITLISRNPDATLSAEDAIKDILTAIEMGLRGETL